jgi:hypothetical protein
MPSFSANRRTSLSRPPERRRANPSAPTLATPAPGANLIDLPGVSPEFSGQEESLLSRTFHRGFAAGQALGSQQFGTLLPWLLEQFVSDIELSASGREAVEARRWAQAFAAYARERSGRLGVELNYVAEGAGI